MPLSIPLLLPRKLSTLTHLSPELQWAICHATGFRADPALEATLARAVSQRLHQLRLPDASAYLAWLANPEHAAKERLALCPDLTSRETFFLRDHGQMAVLRDHVIPDLLARQSTSHQLRVWSAACSTGEEPYSLAILLGEATAGRGHWQIDILGSDIDAEALEIAGRACYRDWSFRGCPAEFRRTYFREVPQGWQLNPNIRQRVRFQVLDLADARTPPDHWGLPGADIILCRNLFIYLDDDQISAILARLTDALADGGYLLVGPGELQMQNHPGLTARVYPEAIVYQKSAVMPDSPEPPAVPPPLIMAPRVPASAPAPKPHPPSPALAMPDPLQRAWHLANRGELRQAETLCQTLIDQSPMNAEPHYLRAVLSLAEGKTDLALEELRKVLYLEADFVAAYPLLIDLFLAQNNRPMAERACRQGIQALKGLPADRVIAPLGTTQARNLLDYLQARQETLNP